MSEIKKTTQEQGVFTYGGEVIDYAIIRRSISSENVNSKLRKVLIKVHPDQRVTATVPCDATDKVIHEAVLKRASWIWKNIQAFSVQREYVMPRRYVSGETQFYLGRRYVLKVRVDEEQKPCVKLRRGVLVVALQGGNDERLPKVRALLNKWYIERADKIFSERLKALLPKANWVVGCPAFRVMVMKKQWGSCSVNGDLMLNPHLIKASKECIDYVILHELCHISEHNHSDKFWRLLTQVMPNWKEVKSKLDDMAELYLNE